MAREKHLPSMALVVALSATLAACDADPGEKVAQRDVYSGPTAFEDCVADWGNEELCQKRLDAEDAKRAAASQSGGGVHSVFIYGPSYSGGERVATYQGQTYTPASTRAAQVAKFTNVSAGARPSFAAAPPRAMSGPVVVASRGGFGGAGHSFGGGGG